MIGREPRIYDAIQALVGGRLAGSTNSFESTQYLDGQTPPTKEEAETKLAELQAEWNAQEYARKRGAEYPSIAELTVALYDTDDKAAIETKRAAVKAKYPKPS